MNSHWLLGRDAVDAVDAWEAGDASVASASSIWVGGQFQANFHWLLEDAAGDVPSFSAWVIFFWVSWMAEMQGGAFFFFLFLFLAVISRRVRDPVETVFLRPSGNIAPL